MSMRHRHAISSAPNVEVDVDVLVVGAGPTGLVAAAEALRLGMSVRIVERRSTRGAFSKALVVHARTLEVFDTMGIAPEVRAVGAPFAALNARFAGSRRRVRIDLLGLPWEDTAYPYWLSVPQYDTERVLEAHLVRLGGSVEWSCALRSLRELGGFVEAELQSDGGTETVRARWVIGCDGGRSTVRDLVGVTLRRTGAGATFLLADVKTTTDLVEDEGHLYLARQGLIILVPMPEPRRWRLIAHMRASLPSEDGDAPVIDAAGIDALILERTGIEFGSHDVSWTSQFDLTHGVADRFRESRIFLAGDAAHIHSPVGGQGLNTGVQDAHNLLWRIAESRGLPPWSAKALLDGYESERRGTAVPMVRGVARMTAVMTARRWPIRQVLGLLAPRILSRPGVQAKLGRDVGMLNLSYAGAARAQRTSGHGLRVGCRLPNPEMVSGGRIFDRLPTTGYSWLVVGDDDAPEPDPSAMCWRGVPVVFVLRRNLRDSSGYPRGAGVVLVRPDRYIAGVGDDPASLADDVLPSAESMDTAGIDDRLGAQR
ncbi:MAG: FAD-dependent monooxygenase [Propionibacteriaceae bacterium]|nr:FAD-dependent monooxygenase [Propionibacteriaceae bacterium]